MPRSAFFFLLWLTATVTYSSAVHAQQPPEPEKSKKAQVEDKAEKKGKLPTPRDQFKNPAIFRVKAPKKGSTVICNRTQLTTVTVSSPNGQGPANVRKYKTQETQRYEVLDSNRLTVKGYRATLKFTLNEEVANGEKKKDPKTKEIVYEAKLKEDPFGRHKFETEKEYDDAERNRTMHQHMLRQSSMQLRGFGGLVPTKAMFPGQVIEIPERTQRMLIEDKTEAAKFSCFRLTYVKSSEQGGKKVGEFRLKVSYQIGQTNDYCFFGSITGTIVVDPNGNRCLKSTVTIDSHGQNGEGEVMHRFISQIKDEFQYDVAKPAKSTKVTEPEGSKKPPEPK